MFPAILPSHGHVGVDTGKEITASALFSAEISPELNSKPPGTGSGVTFTISTWVKRAEVGVNSVIAGGDNPVTTAGVGFYFDTADKIRIWMRNSSSTVLCNAGTVNVFRDTGAWYHVFFVWDSTEATGADRIRIWVNGVEQTMSYVVTPTLNLIPPGNGFWYDTHATYSSSIGHWLLNTVDYTFSGYIADFYLLDGIVGDVNDFGYLSEIGVWVPDSYTGAYGSNGFFLDFSNAADLGEDQSGNGNDLTNSNTIASSDTPTNNHSMWNILRPANFANIYDAAQQVISTNLNKPYAASTLALPRTGKWYWEILFGNATAAFGGIYNSSEMIYDQSTVVRGAFNYATWSANGNTGSDGTAPGVIATFTAADVIGYRYDADAGTLKVYKNDVYVDEFTDLANVEYVIVTGDTNTSGSVNVNLKASEDNFVYSLPTGFNAPLASNMDDPEIVDGRQYFNAVPYAGNGTSQSVVCGFQPDLVWVKCRDNTRYNNFIDSERGVGNYLISPATAAEAYLATTITAFNSDGFDVGSSASHNQSGENFVAWCFKKKAGFFDIVTYTGDGTTSNVVSHNLGVPPELVITKSLDSAVYNWLVQGDVMGLASAGYYMTLNTTGAAASIPSVNTTMASDTMTLDDNAAYNADTLDHVAYLFASVPGFCKIDYYGGNGSVDGGFVHCGFRPAFVMLKAINDVHSWYIYDSGRTPENLDGATNELYPNLTNVEFTTNERIDFLSNGFKLRGSGVGYNASGTDYMYIAIAETPFKYSRAR